MPDTSKNTYVPMNFKVSWGFPTLAKAGVLVVTVLGVGIAGLIIWGVEKVRRSTD